MTATTLPPTDGQVMSWDDYTTLDEGQRAEYLDGRLVVSPRPSQMHQRISRRLADALEDELPDGIDVSVEWAWKVGDDELVPDVLVHPRTGESVRFTGQPLLAVEVLSSNRSADLVTKSVRYAAAGLPHYWVVDPREDHLDAWELRGGIYRPVAHVTAGEPADVSLGPVSLRVDLDALTADRKPRR